MYINFDRDIAAGPAYCVLDPQKGIIFCIFFELTRGLILGRGFVPEPSIFAVKSLGLGVRELKIQSLGFGVREQKKL